MRKAKNIENWVKVSSTNIAGIGYEEETQTLYVQFSHGGTYSYSGVPSSVFEDFKMSQSKGTFFHTHIKNEYSYKKV